MTAVTVQIVDTVAVVRMDDGKANALTFGLLDQLHAALDQADKEANAVCFVGRAGRFCAGFDLSVMTSSPEAARALVQAGTELMLRIYGLEQPTVAACTGHAMAGGALFLLACDTRIGTAGSFKIGLNETAIGMGLPAFAVELARDRLVKTHFIRATLQAQLYDPAGAVAVGYLDEVVAPEAVEATAIAVARQLGTLKRSAYGLTKHQARGALIAELLAGLPADMAKMVLPTA